MGTTLKNQFTSVCLIERDGLKGRQMEWRAGELSMRESDMAYERRSSGRDGRGETERGQQSDKMPNECQESGWIGTRDRGLGLNERCELPRVCQCMYVNLCECLCKSMHVRIRVSVRVCLGRSGGADAASAPGLLLYGLLRKRCCANLCSHPQPITRLDPRWSRVNAYAPTHMHAYTSMITHAGGNSIMSDKGNRWKVCVPVVILFIKVQRTVCACNHQEAFGTHTHTHTGR